MAAVAADVLGEVKKGIEEFRRSLPDGRSRGAWPAGLTFYKPLPNPTLGINAKCDLRRRRSALRIECHALL